MPNDQTHEFKGVNALPFEARYDNYIGGEWVAPKSGKYFTNTTPITGAEIGQIAITVGDLDAAGTVQARRADAEARLASLSAREREVLDRVAAGHYNKVIAAELGISLSTVEIHRKRVMEKLHAESLSDLIRLLALLDDAP